MKRLWTVLTLVPLTAFAALADGTNAVAPQKIGAPEAHKHYDETLTVTGQVAQVTIREKVVFINLDQPHPNAPFTAVVFAANTNQFGDIAKLKNKGVEITGKIQEFNGTAETVLDSTNQLKIMGEGKADK